MQARTSYHRGTIAPRRRSMAEYVVHGATPPASTGDDMALVQGTIINEAARVGSRPATRVRVRTVVQQGRYMVPRHSRYSGQYGIVVRVHDDTLMVRLPGGAVVPFGYSELEVLA